MIGAATLVLVVAVVFSLVGPRLGRQLPPAVATRVLVPASVAVTAATGSVFTVAAFTLVGQLPQIANAGRWSAQGGARRRPGAGRGGRGLRPARGARAAYAVVVLLRRLIAFAAVQRICRGSADGSGLIIVDNAVPDAFATPDLRGGIVVTTGLMKALEGTERRAGEGVCEPIGTNPHLLAARGNPGHSRCIRSGHARAADHLARQPLRCRVGAHAEVDRLVVHPGAPTTSRWRQRPTHRLIRPGTGRAGVPDQPRKGDQLTETAVSSMTNDVWYS